MELTGSNSYSGGTTVHSGGILVVNNTSGSATGSGTVTVSGSLYGNGTVQGEVVVNGQITPGDVFADPYILPGTLTTGSQQWNAGGTYYWELYDAEGTAGAADGWDLLVINGDLTVNATEEDPFVIYGLSKLYTDGRGGPEQAPTDNFDADASYRWLIATADSSLEDLNLDAIRLFTPDIKASPSRPDDDLYYLSTEGNHLYINYGVIPEPTTLGLLLAAIGFLYHIRRKLRHS